jgi:hypothetical protein
MHAAMPRQTLSLLAALALLVGLGRPAAAQPAPKPDPLRLVPDDFGLCLVVNDLRANLDAARQAPWVRAFLRSGVGEKMLQAPEWDELRKVERELKKHVGLDWPTLRDDVLGDRVVFAFRPGSAKGGEQGLILLHTRAPERVADVIDRFNKLQRGSGELKSLEPTEYRGVTFYRREHVKNTHYYFQHAGLVAVSASEAQVRQVIDRLRAEPSAADAWPERFRRAGADTAAAAVALNPRAFDAELLAKGGNKAPGLATLWRGLDAAFLTLTLGDAPELRLAVLARPGDLPDWARTPFTRTPRPSAVWRHVPDDALLVLAARTDFPALAAQLLELMPAKDRRKATDDLQRMLGGLTALDLRADVLPNVGPDWGVCVLPPGPADAYPHVLAALEIHPGDKAEKVDQTVLRGLQLAATLAVLQHNAGHPNPLKLQTVKQDAVEVHVLSGDQALPAGLRPAFALKGGFLLLATSPDAIAAFRRRDDTTAPAGATPLLRVALDRGRALLQSRRDAVAENLQKRQSLSRDEADRKVSDLLDLLGVFDRVDLTQRGDAGQATWALRAIPRPQ